MILNVDKHIVLRQLELSDAQDIFNTIDSQREHLGPFLPFVEATKQLSDTQAFVESVINSPKDRMEYTFTIRVNSRLAGLIGFKDTDRTNRKTEIGYWLSRDFLGRGIMTRSVSTLCDFAFRELDINRIQIKCAVANTASRNIPQRLGFQLEGIERAGELLTGGIFTDLAVYSRLKGDG
ncbi:MAG: GNAT family protein [Bacteroidales bacterium]|nr:GNAT family protein [Bacteroidales bacterium]MDD3521674.1 GNAT family protein [Bacteroidales bacterium]MDD4031453.1 GNAT family protein [Bacteroidales bacterium]MDD4435900.1 GNAT family protein [Bacteroidales bacterium]